MVALASNIITYQALHLQKLWSIAKADEKILDKWSEEMKPLL